MQAAIVNLGQRINRYWRIFATGLAFSTFGLFGVLLAIGVFPLIHVFSRTAEIRQWRARAVVQRAMWLFVRWMQILGVNHHHISGTEHLKRKGVLIAANHPSLIDAVLLLAHVPQATCIVKAALARNLFTAATVRAAGYISNDTDPEMMISRCAQAIERGEPLLIFPEGTRQLPSEVLTLQRGAARIALSAGCGIIPVHIAVLPYNLGKGMPWYAVPEREAAFTLTVGPEIASHDYAHLALPIAARRLTDALGRGIQALRPSLH